MEHYLQVTTEVNGEKVIAHRKTFLEYPEEENHKCLFFEARKAAANITGIKEAEIEEGKHFLWDYEEYNEEKHDHLNCVDLTEVYEPMFYPGEGIFTREQLIKAQHKFNNQLVDVPEDYAHDKKFFRTKEFADSQISELLSLTE